MKKSELRKFIRKIIREQNTSPIKTKPFIKPQKPATSRVRLCCPDDTTINGIIIPLYHSYDPPPNGLIGYAPWKNEKGQCLYDKNRHMRMNPTEASLINALHGQPFGQEPERCMGEDINSLTNNKPYN